MDDKNYEENGFSVNGEENTESISAPSDDDFVIGKGFDIEDVTSHAAEDKKKSKNKKQSGGKSVVKTLVWLFAIIIVSVGLAFGLIYAGADYMGIGFGRGENVELNVERGSSSAQIAEALKETGAVKIPQLFRFYAKIKHYDSKFKYGVYTFNNEAGYEALAEMLMEEGAQADSVTVTIPEMSSIDDIAKLLEEKGVCKSSDFIDEVQNGEFKYDFIKDIPTEKVYYRLEGYLFPDTYDFYSYDSKECAHLAVDKMLKTLNNKLTDSVKKDIENSGYTFHEIMTLASVVELEAGGSPDEMANVAAVFVNRLKSDEYGKLESSPTKKYPYGGGKYDTYESRGLPPGPLCSPSLKSITAAAKPTPSFDYYFFVTDAKMKFYYNKTYAEHNTTIAKLKRENNWIGDK